MGAAAARGEHPPLAAAAELCGRLFSVQNIPLGAERSVADGPRPCGLWADAERSRLARPHSVEMLNSRGEWEPQSPAVVVPLGELMIPAARVASAAPVLPIGGNDAAGFPQPEPSGKPRPFRLPRKQRGRRMRARLACLNCRRRCRRRTRHRPAPPLYVPAARTAAFMRGVGLGNLCKLRHADGAGDGGGSGGGSSWSYGRELPLAVVLNEREVRLVKGMRARLELVGGEAWQGRNFPAGGRLGRRCSRSACCRWSRRWAGAACWRASSSAAACSPRRSTTAACRSRRGAIPTAGPAKSGGAPQLPRLLPALPAAPRVRGVRPRHDPRAGLAQLGLIEPDGTPTLRGTIFGFFNHGEGLAVAAALEQPEKDYPIEALIYDLANLRAGHRFTPEGENPYGGRLGSLCARVYGRADHPGYLEMGVPTDYGDGAAEVVAELAANPAARAKLLNESLRLGDLERALTEWRSLLTQVAMAPDHPWERWQALQAAARRFVDAHVLGALPTFPPLSAAQSRRYQHRIYLRGA